jgi:GTP-binding protein
VFVEEGVSFVMADIPGIIEGASEGAGLGHDFLRHIYRCRLLIHVVDASGSEGRDPVEDLQAINRELREYSPTLGERKQLIAANKTDILQDKAKLERLRTYCQDNGLRLFEISAAAHKGVRELILAAAEELRQLPPIVVYEPEIQEFSPGPCRPEDISIAHYDDVWILEGEWLARLVRNANFGDYESRQFFDRTLRDSGIYDRLETLGISDGDTVSIFDVEFEYRH